MRYELRIALRYLRARRKTAFISVTTVFTAVGVMIGVAALIVTIAVMNGFEAEMRTRIAAALAAKMREAAPAARPWLRRQLAMADRVAS